MTKQRREQIDEALDKLDKLMECFDQRPRPWKSCSHSTKSSRRRSKKHALPTSQSSSIERYRLWSA
jgi:hypothetical protein